MALRFGHFEEFRPFRFGPVVLRCFRYAVLINIRVVNGETFTNRCSFQFKDSANLGERDCLFADGSVSGVRQVIKDKFQARDRNGVAVVVDEFVCDFSCLVFVLGDDANG